MSKKFYVTAAIPYVNAKPHIGHALEFVQTNTVARYHKLLGEEVLTLSGGDENALKNVQAAEKEGIEVQEFVDKNTEVFRELTEKLDSRFDVWQKGSSPQHHSASQELWRRCQKDIYKKSYRGLYCVGCEMFYTREELDDKGECLEHPGKKLEEVEEENYFFALSRYQSQVENLLESEQLKIVPEERKNEVLAFVKRGLQDISVSRSNSRAKNWGVPVPGDVNQRLYVWLDALNIYQSGVGFGWDESRYNKWWPADVHVIGKGIIRFHAVYWPAFLLSAGLPLPKEIFVHGYYTVEGQKMSKTLGNVYDPVPLLEKYGADPLRYFMLAKTSPTADGDFSELKFKEAYNSDLANGLGNLVARVARLAEKSEQAFDGSRIRFTDSELAEVRAKLGQYKFDEAIKVIWRQIAEVDKEIEAVKPWTKQGEELAGEIRPWVEKIRAIAVSLIPLLPATAEKIMSQYAGPKIEVAQPLFPRLQ